MLRQHLPVFQVIYESKSKDQSIYYLEHYKSLSGFGFLGIGDGRLSGSLIQGSGSTEHEMAEFLFPVVLGFAFLPDQCS